MAPTPSLKALLKAALFGTGAAVAVWLTLSLYMPYGFEISAIVGGVAGAYYCRAPLKKGLTIGLFTTIIYVPMVIVLAMLFVVAGLIHLPPGLSFLSMESLLLFIPRVLLAAGGGMGGGAIGAFIANALPKLEPSKKIQKPSLSPDVKILRREKTDSDLGEGELILTEREVAYVRPKFVGTEVIGVLALDQIAELSVEEDDLIIASKNRRHEFGVRDPEDWEKTVKGAMQNLAKTKKLETPGQKPLSSKDQ